MRQQPHGLYRYPAPIKLFRVGKKTLLTYKPIVRKINCAVTLSQKRENIVIYAKALIFFCELAQKLIRTYRIPCLCNQAACLFIFDAITQRPKLHFLFSSSIWKESQMNSEIVSRFFHKMHVNRLKACNSGRTGQNFQNEVTLR